MSNIHRDYLRCRPAGRPGVLAVVGLAIADVGFRAVLTYRLARACRTRGLATLAGILDRVNLHVNLCTISSAAEIGPGFRIAHVGGIVIGGKTRIGANCDMRQNTTLGGDTGKHREGDLSWTQPRLGDNILIGCNVAILGPVHIASDTVIGACALVIKDIDQPGSYGGVPAKRLR